MELSVVVPTLNGRARLAAGLDALATHAPEAEVVVVNGPSADGTTGMVRERDDVDVLVEVSDRTVAVARNAGIEAACGDAIAIVDYDTRITASWYDGVIDGLSSADAVTGPVRPAPADEPTPRADVTQTRSTAEDQSATANRLTAADQSADGLRTDTPDGNADDTSQRLIERPEERTIVGRTVTYFPGENVAFRREALEALDGFDEYLRVGAARDAAHRLAGMDHEIRWADDVAVWAAPPNPTAADGGRTRRDWGWKYRALTYRLVKNYGIRPTVASRTMTHALTDALSVATDVVRGDATPSGWAANGRDVVAGVLAGSADGIVSRLRDRTPTRNPYGVSDRADRAVTRYDDCTTSADQ